MVGQISRASVAVAAALFVSACGLPAKAQTTHRYLLPTSDWRPNTELVYPSGYRRGLILPTTQRFFFWADYPYQPVIGAYGEDCNCLEFAPPTEATPVEGEPTEAQPIHSGATRVPSYRQITSAHRAMAHGNGQTVTRPNYGYQPTRITPPRAPAEPSRMFHRANLRHPLHAPD